MIDGTAGAPRNKAAQSESKNAARVWNYWLGGGENYPADQEAAKDVVLLYPDIVEIARQDRLFLARALRYLVSDVGIRQFVDIGAGLPAEPNIHELAQAAAPESRVAYVDNDEIVLAHARAWMTNSTPEGAVSCIEADVLEPEQLVERLHPTIDLSRPTAIIMMAVLGHACPTAPEMYSVIGRLMSSMAPGSYLVIGDGMQSKHQGFARSALKHNYHLRTLEEFQRCFDGFELVEPGVVPLNLWRPDEGYSPDPLPGLVGVARKPDPA